MLGYGDDVMLYIDSARDFVLPRTIVYTESMRHVGQQITDGHTDICLTGPKGCGKSTYLHLCPCKHYHYLTVCQPMFQKLFHTLLVNTKCNLLMWTLENKDSCYPKVSLYFVGYVKLIVPLFVCFYSLKYCFFHQLYCFHLYDWDCSPAPIPSIPRLSIAYIFRKFSIQ